MDKDIYNILELQKDLKTKDIGILLNNAFKKGNKTIFIPEGDYIISNTLYIPSNTVLKFSKKAYVKCKEGFADFCAFSNEDIVNGNENIEISGGIFDGQSNINIRKSYKDTEKVGFLFSFISVNNLKLRKIEMKNSICYHIRLVKTTNFQISNIRFTGTYPVYCQDGVHICGGCHNGKIEKITAEPGSLGDDLIALTADDALFYGQGKYVENLPISNIRINKIIGTDCFTGIRLLSITQKISEISIQNVVIGYHEHGLNLDGSRECADMLFDPKEFSHGVGYIENVIFNRVSVWNTNKGERKRETITLQSNVKNLVIKKYKHLVEKEKGLNIPSMLIADMDDVSIKIDKEIFEVKSMQKALNYVTEASKIIINCKNI